MADQAAYTLIELMVGMMILGIILASTFSAMKQGFYLIESTRNNTQVSQILQDEMESLRTMNWSAIEALQSSGGFFEEISGYTCQRVISAPKANQLEVVLTVSWTNSRNMDFTTKYITYFTKEGVNDFYIRSY